MIRHCTLACVLPLLLPLAALCETPSLNVDVLIKAPKSERFGRILPVIKVLKDRGVRNVDFELSDSDEEGIVATIRIHAGTRREDADELAGSLKKAGVSTAALCEAIPWRDFSSAKLKELQGRNKPVLVFCRADWDVTPQILDRTLFTDRRVIEAIKQLKYSPLRADFTNPSEEISSFLRDLAARPGEATIVVFRGPKNENPIVLQMESALKFISVEDLLDAIQPARTVRQ